MPPEGLNPETRPAKSRDIYSYGLLVYEIWDALQRLPYENEDGIVQCNEETIKKGFSLPLDMSAPSAIQSLIEDCLNTLMSNHKSLSQRGGLQLNAREVQETTHIS